jgi:hypothetical protein
MDETGLTYLVKEEEPQAAGFKATNDKNYTGNVC